MRLPCPFCGLRDDGEFSYEGDAGVVWPPLDAPEADWLAAVFLRDQPKGRARELWRHARGCRSWIVIERDNVTHEVFAATLAHPGMAAAMAAADGEGVGEAGGEGAGEAGGEIGGEIGGEGGA